MEIYAALWVVQCLWKTMRGRVVERNCERVNHSVNHSFLIFEKRKGLRKTLDVRYFRYLPSFSQHPSAREAWNFISSPKLTREKERETRLLRLLTKVWSVIVASARFELLFFILLSTFSLSLSLSLFLSKYGRKDVETCRKFSTRVLYTRSVCWPEWKNATRLSR